MKKITLLLVALLLSIGVFATTTKRELRSCWLTTYMRIDWPSNSSVGSAERCKQDLINYLDKHQNRNYTGVCLHVRTLADAVYESSYEPWSEFLTGTRGKDPGWDPLAFAVEECHKRGLECYAWINPFRFARNNAKRETPADIYVQNQPGWIIDNGTITEHNEYRVFNPARQDVRDYLLTIMREIYTNYRIDGMLFDDYFYPNGIPATNQAQDYQDFLNQNPGFSGNATQLKKAMGNWRRNNINEFMRQLYAMIQNDRPDLRFGLSPAGVARNGCADIDGLDPVAVGSDWQYDDIYSDPVAWLNDGSIDFISPQIYWFSRPGNHGYTSAAPYPELCEWWSYAAHFFNRHFYSSMAPYRMGDSPGYNNETSWEDLSHQIDLNRRYNLDNAPGAIMYSAKYMDGPGLSGWGDYLQEHSFQNKTLNPVITWKEHPALPTPEVSLNGTKLTWTVDEPTQTGYAPIRRYTVYAVPGQHNRTSCMMPDGDGIDAEFLLTVVYGHEFQIPANRQEGYWYAVCTYDGYGFESTPGYVNEGVDPAPVARETTEYPEVDNCKITNLWYRSNLDGFKNIDFVADGKRNRGMLIVGDQLLVTSREEDSKGPCSLIAYNLLTGHQMGSMPLDIDENDPYPCNDIFRDNAGNIYISSIALNIQAENNALRLYKYNPATRNVTLWTKLNANISRARVDHCAVEANQDGTYYVWAAQSSGKNIIRWTVKADGTVSSTESRVVSEFHPASASNFGIAPRIIAKGNNRLIIDGGSTMPAEYDYMTGAIVDRFNESLNTHGYQANGFAHFGENSCFMAYPVADHSYESGYKFNITNGTNHTMASQNLMWTIPAINMGNVSSTTMSAPVDAVSTFDASTNTLTSHIAIYAPGNTLAVYEMTKKVSSGLEDATDDVIFKAIGRSVYFSRSMANVVVYDLSGRVMAEANEVSRLELPSVAGIYIVRFDGKAAKVVVR